MHGSTNGLRRVHQRRQAPSGYQEIWGRFVFFYGESRARWTARIRVRDFEGDPLRGQYVTLASVSGKDFHSLGELRKACHQAAVAREEPKPVPTEDLFR